MRCSLIFVRAVNNNGILNYNYYNNDGGVRPFRWIARKSRQYAEISASPSKERIAFPLNNMTDFEKVTSFENLYYAYRRAKRGKGYKASSAKFETMALDGINCLKSLLETRGYQIKEYFEFKVYEPKERVIKAGAFVDKIVQHSLCDNVLLPKLASVFIRNNFAGQIGKGTLFGLETLKKDMLGAYTTHGMNIYILKADVTKFFYNIDHEILKKLVAEQITDDGIRWLCNLIIDSTDGKGLPLGNQTSQVFALLYLNGLDHYITETLGIQYYGRYMDDFYLIHKDKEYLKYCLKKISEYVNGLELTLNGKTQIMPFKNGIKFLGFHTYIRNGKVVCKIRNENKHNAVRKYKKMANLVVAGKLSREKFDECYTSWKAHASHGDCDGIIHNLDKQIKEILQEDKL
jgi:hypothetical protein